MTTIQPTGASGVANLPSASTASPTEAPNDGLEWGIHVADNAATDPTFNFDTYAQGVATSMASAGFSPSQVTQFVNAMYAGYMLEGGTAASQASGAYGSGVSTAGVVGNPGAWGSLELPGQNGAAGIEISASTSVGLTPSTGYAIGTQLGGHPGSINYAQWRDNMSADLQRAGYSQTDVNAFMQQLDKGYQTAQGHATSNPATTGTGNTATSSPATTGTGNTATSNPATTGTGNTATSSPATTGTGNTATSSPATTGTGNTATSSPATTGNTGGLTQAAASMNSYHEAVAASAPASANSLYGQYVSSSNPTLAGDANTLQGSLSTLTSVQSQLAYAESAFTATNNGAPAVADSTGHMQNASYWGSQVGALQAQQKTAWTKVRTQEASFFKDLSQTSSDTNASMASAVYQNYTKDPSYTLEGEMPSSWTGTAISAGTSTGTSSQTLAPVSSAALNALLAATSASALPATVSNELTTPFASKSISTGDYTQIVEGYMKLFQKDPASYYQSLANIKDPNLAGAINFAVNDMAINCPKEMVANGATLATEQKQIGTYYAGMKSNPSTSTYYNWAPAQAAQNYTGPTDIKSMVGNWRNASDVNSLLSDPNATSDNKHNEHNFSDAAQLMASMYKTNPSEYYQLLGKVADPKLRDALNRAVLTEFAKNPSHYNDGGNHDADQDFKAEWPSIVGQAGATAGSSTATDANIGLNANDPTNGSPQ